jgi:acetyl esterase/lipase
LTASWQARVAAFVVRRRVKPALGDMTDIARIRRSFRHGLPAPGACATGPTPSAACPASGSRPNRRPTAPRPATTLLYLHGGGFVGCRPRTHRPLTAALARQGLRVFVPDYRLAPEHPFPAAPHDALAVWRALRAQRPGGRLVVAGDSAGGNLALGLMLGCATPASRCPTPPRCSRRRST